MSDKPTDAREVATTDAGAPGGPPLESSADTQPQAPPVAPPALPLTKFLDPADFSHPDLNIAVAALRHHAEHLKRISMPAAFPSGDTRAERGRFWEYGMGMLAARHAGPGGSGPRTICDVGTGRSLFLPALMAAYPDASAVAVEPNVAELAYQLAMTNHKAAGMEKLPAPGHGATFDFVSAISVIEHELAEEDLLARLAAAVAPGGVLFLTTDAARIQPDLYQFHWMRARIYTPAEWQAVGHRLGTMMEKAGRKFEFLGKADFTWKGSHVYDYSFCSMALRRTK